MRGAAVIGSVAFASSTRYASRAEWEAESALHLVDPQRPGAFGWDASRPKWAWRVAEGSARRCSAAGPPPSLERMHRSLYVAKAQPGNGVASAL